MTPLEDRMILKDYSLAEIIFHPWHFNVTLHLYQSIIELCLV